MRIALLIAGAILALPAAGVVGSAAFADPSGCTAAVPDFGVNSAGRLQALGEGHCGTSANRNLQVEVKHDLSVQPDPVVVHANDVRSSTYYSATPAGCDNGNTANYYGRAFFTTKTTYHDTTSRKFSVC